MDLQTLCRHTLLRVVAISTAVFTLLPLPVHAQVAQPSPCDKASGIQKLRCERHDRMAALCGAHKGEEHHVCDRSFLLVNPLSCTALPADEAPRCEAEKAAFKACEAKAGRAFMVCVRDSIKESPMGAH